MDSLYTRVPKDLLPQDYGGCCESLQILHGWFHPNTTVIINKYSSKYKRKALLSSRLK